MIQTNCPECDAKLPINVKNCPNCGHPVNTLSIEIQDNQKKESYFSKPVLLGLVVFIFISGITLYFHNSKNNMNPDASDSMPDTLSGYSDDNSNKAHKSSLSSSLDNLNIPVGVYAGDSNSTLAICDNGYAYYFSDKNEYIEPECPWRYENNILYIDFEKYHCTVYAKEPINDFSEITLKSDNPNWKTRVFEKIDCDPDVYPDKSIPSNDPEVDVAPDGTLEIAICNTIFNIPKKYKDVKDDYDKINNFIVLYDEDKKNDYMASLIFHTESTNYSDWVLKSNVKKMLLIFCKNYARNIELGNMKETIIGSCNAYIVDFKGISDNFAMLHDESPITGKLVYMINPDSKENLYVLMLGSANNKEYLSEFDEILNNAK